MRYFVATLRFVSILALFGRLWAKKSALIGQKQCFMARSALLHGTYCILCRNQFANLQLRAKIANTRLTKNFVAIFALAERLPTSATLNQLKPIFFPHNKYFTISVLNLQGLSQSDGGSYELDVHHFLPLLVLDSSHRSAKMLEVRKKNVC